MIRTPLGVLLLTAAAAFAQAEPKPTSDLDARLAAIDQQLAEFAKLGFDPRARPRKVTRPTSANDRRRDQNPRSRSASTSPGCRRPPRKR